MGFFLHQHSSSIIADNRQFFHYNVQNMFQSINAYTGKEEASFEPLNDTDLTQKLELSEKVFQQWKSLSFAQRAEYLKKVAAIFRSDKTKLAALITREMGKPIHESEAEIEKSALVCEYYAENAETFLKDENMVSDADESFVAYEPIGTVFAIMPWNFPFWQVFRFAAPALMAGNTALLKHASNVPACGAAIEEVFLKAGLPDGVFQNLFADIPQMEAIISHAAVKAITLTGSERAGKSVAALAGKYLKKSVLELGGSDPFIVLADADVDQATDVVMKSRIANAGQTCIASKRFILEKSISAKFTALLIDKISKVKLGDPMLPETNMGPMVHAKALEQLQEQVDKSVKLGAKVLYRHTDVPKGNFFPPTVLGQITKEMPAYSEELFGPVISIFEVGNTEEAIQLANDTSFGLGASIWTKNTETGKQIARKIDSGAVFVNGIVKSDPRLPFGGTKSSGYGRELGHQGIREFVNQKTIWIK